MSIATIDTSDAERRALRIGLRLDAIADNYEAVLPMIREALDKGDHETLGYASPGAYLADRFGNALSRMPIVVRREFVGELTEAGLSTRAIAAVTDTCVGTVHNDRQVFRSEHLTDEPGRIAKVTGPGSAADPHVNTETGEVSDNYLPDDTTGGEVTSPAAMGPAQAAGQPEEAPGEEVEHSPAPSRPDVTGIDGKTYKQREKPKPRRKALTDQAKSAGWELRKSVERIERIAEDNRFEPQKEAMASHLRGHLTNAIEVCQDLLDRINTQEESTK